VSNVERAENCRKAGCPDGGDRVEPEGNQEAQNIVSRGSMEESGAGSLLEKVLDRDNLNKAFKRVKSKMVAARE
jgi:hypothetical protein